jgi:hypothetical protein
MPKTARDNAEVEQLLMENERDKSVRLLTFYLSSAWEAAGLGDWVEENTREVEQIVGSLIVVMNHIADQRAQEAVEAHRENEPHLYADGSSS